MPNYTFSPFWRAGLDALIVKSALASIAVGVAALQVFLAFWIYRKPPPAAKVLLVQSRRLPGWAMPVAGARSPPSSACSWYTSALETSGDDFDRRP
jgi:hypothetical protein